jgi:hypothetical protein
MNEAEGDWKKGSRRESLGVVVIFSFRSAVETEDVGGGIRNPNSKASQGTKFNDSWKIVIFSNCENFEPYHRSRGVYKIPVRQLNERH